MKDILWILIFPILIGGSKVYFYNSIPIIVWNLFWSVHTDFKFILELNMNHARFLQLGLMSSSILIGDSNRFANLSNSDISSTFGRSLFSEENIGFLWNRYQKSKWKIHNSPINCTFIKKSTNVITHICEHEAQIHECKKIVQVLFTLKHSSQKLVGLSSQVPCYCIFPSEVCQVKNILWI